MALMVGITVLIVNKFKGEKMKIVLFNDIGSDSFLYVDGRLSLANIHIEAKKHYDKMVKFKGSFSNEYGIGKSIKSINSKQFKIEV